MITVGIFLFDKVEVLDFAGPFEPSALPKSFTRPIGEL